MSRLNYAAYYNTTSNPWRRVIAFSIIDWRVSAYSLIVISFLLIILSNFAHGDDLTGLPHDDPKDILPTPPAPSQPNVVSMFAPMPSWAHSTMPALPYQLTPMGKKPATVAATTTTGSTRAPLAPPKDDSVSASVPATQAAVVPKQAAVPVPETPAFVAVSPFLQWIKSNPQAAAAEARQQAGAQTPTGPVPNPISAGAAGGPVDPYWLPPLIDTAGFGTTPVGGSAAIYTTPQR